MWGERCPHPHCGGHPSGFGVWHGSLGGSRVRASSGACRGGSPRLARPAILRLPRLRGLTHTRQHSAAAPPRLPHDSTIITMTAKTNTLPTTPTYPRSLWGGDTSPRVELHPPGYRRGDLTDSPRYQTPRVATRSRSRRVLRTPYRLRHRPATRRCGLIIMSALVAGLAGRCHLLRLVAAARHPDRYGLRRFACRSGVSSASAPARRVAGSSRYCAHADVSASPVWQPRRSTSTGCHAPCHELAEPPLLRSHTRTGTGCRTALRDDNHWRTCGSR